jgi:4-amino-4-deoxy-L-arabinose transferase-like glycosyltransferase
MAERGARIPRVRDRWRTAPEGLWLAVIVACGAALRFSTLGTQSFDLDESVTVALLHQGLHATLSSLPTTESTPPVYYVVAWLWTRAFGSGEIGLRSASALAGTLTVGLAYDIGRRLLSRRAGLIVAALTATSPFLIWYSQEARAYALLGLLAAASFSLFVALSVRPSARTAAAWAAVSALALATHYFAAFLVAAEAVWLLLRLRPRRHALLATGAVGLVGAGLLPLAIAQAHRLHDNAGFLATPLHSRIAAVPTQFVLGPSPPAGSKAPLAALTGLLIAGGLLLVLLGSRRDARTLAAVRVVAFVGAGAVLVPVAMALVGADYLDARNLIAAWIPLAVVPAAGYAARPHSRGLIATGALVGVFVALTVAFDADRGLQRTDYRGAVATLDRGVRSAIVVTPWFNWTPLTHYLPGAPALRAGAARVTDVVLLGWRTQPLRAAAVRLLASRGFRLVRRSVVQKLVVVTFRAGAPTSITRRELIASRLGEGVPTLLRSGGRSR